MAHLLSMTHYRLLWLPLRLNLIVKAGAVLGHECPKEDSGDNAGRSLTLTDSPTLAIRDVRSSERVYTLRLYREVTARHAMLIHCPDEETATRVLNAAGKKVTPLSATTLELHDAKPSPALLRKLREAGIFWRT
jgi:hypothetical protein